MIPEEGYYQPEVFPWDGGYELTEELSFMKRKVIPFLLNHPYSGPFRLPVNAKAEGIYPDYFKVVTKPMDLTTVKARLDNKYYSELTQCVADIQQVWTNAKLYNPAEHTIHKWAEELDLITRSWVAKCQVQELSTPPSVPTIPAITVAPRRRTRNKKTAGKEMPPPSQTPAYRDEELEKANQSNLKACENILDTIMSDDMSDYAEPFLQITTRYSNDSYKPMDLSQIKENLTQGVYKNAQEFATDFRLMISETYRFNIDKDPLIYRAQELSHQFEFIFAKQVQFTKDDLDDMTDRTTVILKDILSIGRAIEMDFGNFVKKEFADQHRNVRNVRLFVKEIENLPDVVMGDVITIMKRNEERLTFEADGTVEVDYNNLSDKTINEIRKLLHAKNIKLNLEHIQNGLNKSDFEEESITMDIS